MSGRSLNKNVKLLATICLIMLAVHAVNIYLNGALNNFGIMPRNIYSLPFIYTTVFLHGSWAHLLNNLFGFIIFGSLCLLRGSRFFIGSSFFIITVTGLLIWLFGRQAVHIGASGWIFGLWSLSIAIAWFERSFVNIVIAIFVVFFYGGMIYGVLPGDSTISFEAHLFGAASGVLYAWMTSKKKRIT